MNSHIPEFSIATFPMTTELPNKQSFLRKQLRDLSGRSRRCVETWAIGIVEAPIQDLIRAKEFPAVRWIEPPRGRAFADPFAATSNGRTYIFFEDYDYSRGKTRISFVETADFKTFGPVVKALEQPFHLSYPYTIYHEGQHFMVPEQWQSGEVALYEAQPFPNQWVKRATLIPNFPAIDSTLFQHADTWWMFSGKHGPEEEYSLYIHHSDSLFGPWEPHPINASGAVRRQNRPGGTPFNEGNRLLRPVQDSSKTYGGQVLINEVTVLTKSAFKEKLIATLSPQQYWP